MQDLRKGHDMTYKITFINGAEGIFGNIRSIEQVPDEECEHYQSFSIRNTHGKTVIIPQTDPPTKLDLVGGESCKVTTEVVKPSE